MRVRLPDVETRAVRIRLRWIRRAEVNHVHKLSHAIGNKARTRTRHPVAWKDSRQKGGCMFVELMPLLAGRTVMITVAREDDKAVRVCIVPEKAKDDENPALTTPLSYTGTPEEL